MPIIYPDLRFDGSTTKLQHIHTSDDPYSARSTAKASGGAWHPLPENHMIEKKAAAHQGLRLFEYAIMRIATMK